MGAEVLALKPDVIVTGPPAAFAFAPGGVYPIRTVPVVFTAVSDPVGAGMVASLSRPGGNMTGLSSAGVEINTKRLELLNEAVPGVRRIAVLAHPGHSLYDRMVKGVRATAQALNIELQIIDVGLTDSLDMAFEAMARARAGGLIVCKVRISSASGSGSWTSR